MFRHKPRRLLQEHGVGLDGSKGAEVREVLSVLFGSVSRHKVQHHDPTKNTFLHDQPHPAVHRHLLGDRTAVLYAGELWRKDNDGHDDPHLSDHLSAAGRRDQPFNVARNAAHRQISSLHHVPCQRLYSHYRYST